MKLTSALLTLALASSALAAKQDQRKAVRNGARALGKGKGGKGKGKGGCGKGDADKCPEGTIYVEYEIKIDKDADRELGDSPNIEMYCGGGPDFDINNPLFLVGGKKKVGCVTDEREWSIFFSRAQCENL